MEATCGRSHLGILTEKGEVYAWGSNHYGQLGNGEAMSRVMMPQPISFFAGMNIIDIASGTFHMLGMHGLASTSSHDIRNGTLTYCFIYYSSCTLLSSLLKREEKCRRFFFLFVS